MEFQSILFADSGQKAGKSVPAFFEDLRLDYIMKIIENQAKGILSGSFTIRFRAQYR